MTVEKHLLGRHDQDDHDPTKKKKDDPHHSRASHAGLQEPLFGGRAKSQKEMAVRRQAWNDANDAGLGAWGRSQAMRLAVDGHRKALKDAENKRRKLSREENGALKHYLKEYPKTTAAGAIVAAGFARNPNMFRAYMKFAERSQRLVRTNPRLSKPFRETFDRRTVTPEVRKSASEMFEGTWGGYTSKINDVFMDGRVLHVIGGVTDKGGRHVGGWTRTVNRGGEVHHDYLSLNGRAQGSGFAKGFYEQSIRNYKKNGFTDVTVLANISVGGYAWARQGFEWAPGTAWQGRAEMIYRAQVLAATGQYSRAEARRAQMLALLPGSRPADFARIGKSKRRMGRDGHEHWFGKDLMLGSNWFGMKPL